MFSNTLVAFSLRAQISSPTDLKTLQEAPSLISESYKLVSWTCLKRLIGIKSCVIPRWKTDKKLT